MPHSDDWSMSVIKCGCFYGQLEIEKTSLSIRVQLLEILLIFNHFTYILPNITRFCLLSGFLSLSACQVSMLQCQRNSPSSQLHTSNLLRCLKLIYSRRNMSPLNFHYRTVCLDLANCLQWLMPVPSPVHIVLPIGVSDHKVSHST